MSANWRAMFVLIPALVCGCAPFQPQPTGALTPSAYTPTAMVQSVTMENSSVHYAPDVFKLGAQRSSVVADFGEPNATQKSSGGLVEDVYAFNPDGTKFVDPAVRPRNIALGVFTLGTSLAVRQARLAMKEKKLTIYKVVYGADARIQSVEVQKPEQSSANAPQQPPVPLAVP
jgi:hypothetical protein